MNNVISADHRAQPPESADQGLLTLDANPILAGRHDPAADLTSIAAATVHRRPSRSTKRELRDLRRAECARQAIAGFERAVEIFGFTKGQFSLIDLISATLDITGPAALTISTWTAAQYDAMEVLEFLRSGRVTSTRWLVDFSFQRRSPDVANEIRQRFGADAIRVSKNHAKFALIQNYAWQIVIRTSMNLNTNPRFEDFTIAHDEEIATFIEGIIEEVWRKQPQALALDRPHKIERWWESNA